MKAVTHTASQKLRHPSTVQSITVVKMAAKAKMVPDKALQNQHGHDSLLFGCRIGYSRQIGIVIADLFSSLSIRQPCRHRFAGPTGHDAQRM
jgi:hypothetical protein